MIAEEGERTGNSGNGPDEEQAPPEPDVSVSLTHEALLTGPVAPDQDDAENQFRQTCEKIREIEKRARHSLRGQDHEHRCSFCDQPSSQAGALCQADQHEVCICLQCAETALQLLRKQGT